MTLRAPIHAWRCAARLLGASRQLEQEAQRFIDARHGCIAGRSDGRGLKAVARILEDMAPCVQECM